MSDSTALKNIKSALNKKDFVLSLMNSHIADTSVNHTFEVPSDVTAGSIYITIDSTYNGTTGTIALNGSNDGTNFALLLSDDESQNMQFTLAASDHDIFQIKRRLFKYYRLVYTKGDATLGNISATFVGIKE